MLLSSWLILVGLDRLITTLSALCGGWALFSTFIRVLLLKTVSPVSGKDKLNTETKISQ